MNLCNLKLGTLHCHHLETMLNAHHNSKQIFLSAEDDRPSYTSPGERLHFPPPAAATAYEAASESHYNHNHRAAVDLLAALNVTLAGA